jgi:hypothetical protein
MKATELRIRNLVNHISFGIVELSGILNDNLKCDYNENEYWDNLEFYKPIPLNEEWLLKLGFEDNQIRNNGLYLRVEFHSETIIFWAGIEDEDLTIESEIPLAYMQHVHQLQNLYYALTGEELTLKNQSK